MEGGGALGRITYCEPYAGEIADLAADAIEWWRDPEQHPLKATDRKRLAAQRQCLNLLEQLMAFRDAAASQAAHYLAKMSRAPWMLALDVVRRHGRIGPGALLKLDRVLHCCPSDITVEMM